MSEPFALSIPPALIDAIARSIAGRLTTESNPTMTASPYMTVVEAAEYLRWPKERIYKLTAARAIPHHKHEGRILLRRDALDAWLDEYAEGPRARDTATGTRRVTRGR